jgi:hypothetical protein
MRVYTENTQEITVIASERVEGSMEYASGHNSFNVLFILSFFASLAFVMIRFA